MSVPKIAQDAVLVNSEPMPSGSEEVRGYDFSNGVNYPALLQSFKSTGFQANHFGRAVDEINRMIKKKLEPLPEPENGMTNYSCVDPDQRPIDNCTIFLAFTSNMISSGVRESIRYLAQNNMIDCMATTAGGIEEDIMKCLAPSYLGDFSLRGTDLRRKGINRIGNLLVPNDNYCKLEDWILPIWDQLLEEQKTQGTKWTPSKVIARLGKEINHPDSVCYWAYKNNIPVFSPALTDGALGDTLYFHSYKNPGLVIDIVEVPLRVKGISQYNQFATSKHLSAIAHVIQHCLEASGLHRDVRKLNNVAVFAKHTGMIVLGGGLIKHHVCNANLMRNGADFSVFVNTGQEFDGSDSGARPDEAVSWGKIKISASPVKVYSDATLVFPLLVAETFARNFRMV